MFYKKRIEELERKLGLLTEALEENESIGTVYSHFIGYSRYNNKRIAERTIRNTDLLDDLLDYLDVEYVTKTKRLRKRKKN